MTIDILYIDVGVNWFNESGGIIAGNTVETNSNADDIQAVYQPPIIESGVSGSISTAEIVA
jgi:hypothetical protein